MTTHPNVISGGDATLQDVADAAGSLRASALLARLAPGAGLPAVAASDDEELSYILDGDGRARLDGRTFAVAAGDCLLRRAGEAPAGLVAGPGGLTAVVFRPRAATPAPPATDPDLLPLPLPPDGDRPPTIVALADVPVFEDHHGPVRQDIRFASRTLGAVTTGMRHVRIAPGARGTPHHCHGAEEEVFLILGGAGVVRLGDETFPVRRGTVVARPPGTAIAHSFIADDAGLELIGWGTREPNDIAYYPDSGKVFLCGVGVIGRLEPADYWDGEV